MDRFDDHKPPLTMERSDHTWGTNLSYSELLAEDLDDRPSRLSLLLGATGRRVPAATGTPGVDRPVAPTTHRAWPGGTPSAAGPNFETAA